MNNIARSTAALRSVNLTTKTPLEISPSETLAYLGGDLPVILLHIANRTHFLSPGDCFPTNGQMVELENPFERGGRDLSIAVDMPLAFASESRFGFDTREGATVTYFRSIEVKNTGAGLGNKKGGAFILKDGAATFQIKSETAFQVTSFPSLGTEFFDAKPATAMPDVERFKHSSGDQLERLEAFSGPYTSSEVGDWFGAVEGASSSDGVILADSATDITVTMEAGDMLFLAGDPDADFKVDMRVMDLGDGNGVARV